MPPVVPRLLGKVHVVVYRLTGGRLGGKLGRWPVVLLTTKGRKSGKPVTVPLLYVDEGAEVGLIASYGGSPTHPAWYLNLQADPRCSIQAKGRRARMVAEILSGEARAALWAKAVAMYPAYADYQGKTKRLIPVVRLRPEG